MATCTRARRRLAFTGAHRDDIHVCSKEGDASEASPSLFFHLSVFGWQVSASENACQRLSSIYVYGLDTLRIDRPHLCMIPDSLWALWITPAGYRRGLGRYPAIWKPPTGSSVRRSSGSQIHAGFSISRRRLPQARTGTYGVRDLFVASVTLSSAGWLTVSPRHGRRWPPLRPQAPGLRW